MHQTAMIELAMQADELTEQNMELDMQKKQLDQANRLKSSFLSNMSHELRTSLNSVLALSGVLIRRLKGSIPVEDLNLVNADPTQFDQALMNLCINARDAMPEGGALVLKTENIILNTEHFRTHPDARSSPCALLSVSETGKGMDRETMQHIYGPFFTTKGVGMGLGPAMVYSINQEPRWFRLVQ